LLPDAFGVGKRQARLAVGNSARYTPATAFVNMLNFFAAIKMTKGDVKAVWLVYFLTATQMDLSLKRFNDIKLTAQQWQRLLSRSPLRR
jgi:hypothetical protein